MKFKSMAFDPKRVKAGPEDGLKEGEFIVYPSTFIRKPDSYGDVIAKGAFVRTIKEWGESGNVLPGLYGHRMDDPSYFIAGASDMGEDEHGWWVKGSFDLDPEDDPMGLARKTYRLVKGRRLSQLSFAYDVREEARVELEDGQKANELRDLKVYEFSFVPIGANQDTSVVAIKALTDGIKAGRVLSSKNETALRDARDAIDSVLSSLGEEDEKAAPAADQHDQEKASGESEAKSGASDEEPAGAKSPASDEEPKAGPSVDLLAAQAHIYALIGQEGVQS
jgi:HK97 family phage prohead protease